MVFNVVRICILFSISDVRQYPLNSPGEMSSRFLLFSIILCTSSRELHALNIYQVLIKVIIPMIKFISIKVKIVIIK